MAKDTKGDTRFKGVTNDPRFRRPASKKTKTVLDSRFKQILTDERFKTAPATDPRGIRTATPSATSRGTKSNVNEELMKFYEIGAESGSDELGTEGPMVDSVSEDESGFKWDASSSSSDDAESIGDDVMIFEEDEKELDEIPLGDTTDKIAIMNCNWDHVTAVDLFVVIQSFLDSNAPGRKVNRVTVHKSDFGADRMEREEMYGPLIEGMPEDEDDSLKSQEEIRILDEQRDAAIRKYERLKRMYYFAIAEFDSINSACIVYDELDGVSGGFISECLDMRFVPEDTPDPSFKRSPVSEADKVPAGYVAPQMDEVANLTMDHSKVTCTWDEDPADRKILMKKLTASQIADLDLAAYLESASEDDEVDADSIRKALFGKSTEDSTSEIMGNMEMSFNKDVESVGKSVAKRLSETGRADKAELTEWEKYLEKRKEAKKAKKMERRQQIDSQRQERIASARVSNDSFRKARAEENAKSSDDEAQPDMEEMAKDARLEKLFTDPKFAVDPTHPSFKKKSSVVNELKRKHRK